MPTIKIKRGLTPASLPALNYGELAYTSSTNGLYIGGNGTGNQLLNPNVNSLTGFTDDGGLYITLVNKTGATSVKGTLVDSSTSYDNACMIVPSSGNGTNKCLGVIYDNGVVDGQNVKVVVSGKAYALLQDGTPSTHGQWCGTSTSQAGRMITMDDPSDITTHWREVGHCLQSVASGTNNLCLVNLHFN